LSFNKKPAWQKVKEVTVESYLVKEVEKIDGQAYKFTSPGRRNVPDRYCVFHNNIDAFVECKRPGATLRQGQVRESRRLEARGKLVIKVSTKKEVDTFILFVKEVLDEQRNATEDIQPNQD